MKHNLERKYKWKARKERFAWLNREKIRYEMFKKLTIYPINFPC